MSQTSNYKSINDIEEKFSHVETTHATTATTTAQTKVRPHTDRFPTLHEVLYRQTVSPVDLWSFYCYMRDNQRAIDYLDFWLDSSQHLILCQRYVAGLKSKLIVDNRLKHASGITDYLATPQQQQQAQFQPPQQPEAAAAQAAALRHKSMSSSVLLELIMNDNILDENDSHRLSAFLRGERGLVVDNPELAEYIDTLNRQSMTSEQLLNELNRNSGIHAYDDEKRISTINPKMLEYFINQEHSSSTASFITREDVKKSAREIFLNYFNKNSIKFLQLPEPLHRKMLEHFESGRDDPDIFNEIRSFVYKVMENEAFPGFLTRFGIMNIPVQIWRFFTAFVMLFIGFWVGYVLIFLDYSRGIRCVVIIPFLLFSYLFISYIYSIDPMLCLSNYSYNVHSTKYGLIPIRDPFVKKILLQRSAWVAAAILLLTACLSCLFIFVPGKRL